MLCCPSVCIPVSWRERTGRLDTATLRSLLGVDRLAAPAGGRTRPPNTVMGPPLGPVPLTPVERDALSTAPGRTAPSVDIEIETAASVGGNLPALQLPEDPAAGDTASTRWWFLAIVLYVLLLIVRSRRRRAAKEEPAAKAEPRPQPAFWSGAADPQFDEPIRPPTPRPTPRRRNAFAPPPRPASAMRAARR